MQPLCRCILLASEFLVFLTLVSAFQLPQQIGKKHHMRSRFYVSSALCTSRIVHSQFLNKVKKRKFFLNPIGLDENCAD